MSEPHRHADTNYKICGSDNHYSHEHGNSGNNIGCSHSISNHGIVEIINYIHAVPAGNQASNSFYNSFTSNELITTNCTDQMIITSPTLNDGNYTNVPDSITEHISNNEYTLIPRIITDPISSNEYTVMASKIKERIINEYTETVL